MQVNLAYAFLSLEAERKRARKGRITYRRPRAELDLAGESNDDEGWKLNRRWVCVGGAALCLLGIEMSLSGLRRLELHHTDPLTVQGEVRSSSCWTRRQQHRHSHCRRFLLLA